MFAFGAGLAALAAFAGWRGAQPPNPLKGPRLVPWQLIMLFAAAGAFILLLAAAHEAGLLPTGP
jgi:hypothetical protein